MSERDKELCKELGIQTLKQIKQDLLKAHAHLSKEEVIGILAKFLWVKSYDEKTICKNCERRQI